MARICAVCHEPPREGQGMRPIRLREAEDLEATDCDELGLYSACMECVDAHRLRIAARIDLDPAKVSSSALC